MKEPHLTLLALFVSLFCTHAQEASERNCRIVFLDRPADAPKTLHLFDGTTSQKVDLPSISLSPPYMIAPGDIQLKLLAVTAKDAQGVSPDAPSVEIPAAYTDFYLLVSSDPENKIAPVKLQAINLESKNFKPGQTLWINHSDKIIEAKLGEQTLSLKPGISKILDTPFSAKSEPTSGYYNASFTYQVPDEDTFAPITEQQWWYDADSRHLGFIVNTKGKLPKIYLFRDFRVPKSAQDDAGVQE